MTVPQAAIDAGMQAVRNRYQASSSDERDNRMAFVRGDVAAALEAAAPHIIAAAIEQNREPADGSMDFLKMAHAVGTAAERDRIRQLAISEADRVDATGNWKDQPLALRWFADLLGGA